MTLVRAVAVALVMLAAPALAGPVTDHFAAAVLALQNPAVVYDASYRRIPYPGGDVPANVGVCSDVVVRAYRAIGIDLQQRVHEDMARHFSLYPTRWRRTKTDTNIDHRRVPNLAVFFARKGKALNVTANARDYAPGDLVTWNLNPKGQMPHIGIVTDRKSADGKRPLMMHNIGGGQVLEDVLFAYPISGHFRYGLD
jgi:uncharacterized protein YijF (DUF1287 family)